MLTCRTGSRVINWRKWKTETYLHDDLRSALDLAIISIKSTSEPQDEVLKFISEAKKVEKVSREAMSNLGGKTEMEKLKGESWPGSLLSLMEALFNAGREFKFVTFNLTLVLLTDKIFEIGNRKKEITKPGQSTFLLQSMEVPVVAICTVTCHWDGSQSSSIEVAF